MPFPFTTLRSSAIQPLHVNFHRTINYPAAKSQNVMQTVGILGGVGAGNAASGCVALLAQKFTQSIQITIHTHENQ